MRIFTGTCSTECATRHKQKPEYPGNWHNFMTSYRFGLDVGANSLGWCVLALREQASRFQSTRPRRGAIGSGAARPGPEPSFNPRAPERARSRIDCGLGGPELSGFNPRAPEGARLGSLALSRQGDPFQSTRPRRGATDRHITKFQSSAPEGARCTAVSPQVSIHAPPKGRDIRSGKVHGVDYSFNPRAPEGSRTIPAAAVSAT